MYSRHFSDNGILPPEYGGTALGRARHSDPPPQKHPTEECTQEERHPPLPSEEAGCPERPPIPRSEGGGLSPFLKRLLPRGVDPNDLLLLAIALLLLSDGCEDELLPLLLLFLLVVH